MTIPFVLYKRYPIQQNGTEGTNAGSKHNSVGLMLRQWEQVCLGQTMKSNKDYGCDYRLNCTLQRCQPTLFPKLEPRLPLGYIQHFCLPWHPLKITAKSALYLNGIRLFTLTRKDISYNGLPFENKLRRQEDDLFHLNISHAGNCHWCTVSAPCAVQRMPTTWEPANPDLCPF